MRDHELEQFVVTGKTGFSLLRVPADGDQWQLRDETANDVQGVYVRLTEPVTIDVVDAIALTAVNQWNRGHKAAKCAAHEMVCANCGEGKCQSSWEGGFHMQHYIRGGGNYVTPAKDRHQ